MHQQVLPFADERRRSAPGIWGISSRQQRVRPGSSTPTTDLVQTPPLCVIGDRLAARANRITMRSIRRYDCRSVVMTDGLDQTMLRRFSSTQEVGMSSAGRSQRFTHVSNVPTLSNSRCGWAVHLRRIVASALRSLFACAVISSLSSLAACEGDSLTQGGGGDASAATLSEAKASCSLQLSPSTVNSGEPVTLSWNASGAQNCNASGGWSGTRPPSGSISTPPLSSNTSYILTCSNSSGSSTLSRQVTVTHRSAPSITLAASPTTVDNLGTSTLKWSVTNATECVADGGWHGAIATSGTWSTGRLSNNTEFEIKCTGPDGSASQEITVTVSSSAPQVTLHANPSTVQRGDASSLTWTSEDATSCVASGAWSGTKSVSGTQSTGAVSVNSTFMLTCTGIHGKTSQETTVTVDAAAPTVALGATPSTVSKGGIATLTWKSTNTTACTASRAWAGSKATSGSQSTAAVDANSTYTLVCTGPGGSASQSATVSVKSPTPTVSLSVGPSAVASGGSATLTWSSANATACSASGAWTGAKATSGAQSTGAVKATSSYTLTCTGPGGSAAQSATVSVKATPPTVRLSASPSSIASGSASALSWSSVDATSCKASGAWSGTKAPTGSQSTGALSANATYVLTCTGTGGTAVQSTTVTVSPHPTATVTLGASPSTVASGSGATLSWSSSNATACTASGAWSGSKALSGSQYTGSLTANATYKLTCTGTGGSSTQSTTVSVTQPNPTVALSASPSTVNSGSGSTLTWSSNHATACTASGMWSGTKATSGSQATGALTANATYVLTCTGAGGSATQAATVSVTTPTPAPTITLSASPSTIASGKSSTVTWASTHATSCTASGGWSGSKATSGSQSTGALKANTTYT